MGLTDKIYAALQPFEGEARGRLFVVLVEPNLSDPQDAQVCILGESRFQSARAFIEGKNVGDLTFDALTKYAPKMKERTRDLIAGIAEAAAEQLAKVIAKDKRR